MSKTSEDSNYLDIMVLQSKYNKDNFNDILIDVDMVFNNLSLSEARLLREPFVRFARNHPNYLNLLGKNLENVKIKRIYSFKKEGDFQINLFEDKCLFRYSNDISIYHELLHMASSYADKDNEVIRIGFSYDDALDQVTLGNGLTEGYTSLLEDRDLNGDKSIYIKEDGIVNCNSYWLANALTRELEVIIGKDKMEELYFCADLEGIMFILSRYIDREEIFKLLEAFDVAISNNAEEAESIDIILNAQQTMRNIVCEYMPDKIIMFDANYISIKNGEYILTKEEREKSCLRLKEKDKTLVRIKNLCLDKISTLI